MKTSKKKKAKSKEPGYWPRDVRNVLVSFRVGGEQLMPYKIDYVTRDRIALEHSALNDNDNRGPWRIVIDFLNVEKEEQQP